MIDEILYHFDRWGSYVGHLDEENRYFLRDGTLRGRLVESRKLYDENGRYLGRLDAQGQYWDERGEFRGYFRAPNGRAALDRTAASPPPEAHERKRPVAKRRIESRPRRTSSSDRSIGR